MGRRAPLYKQLKDSIIKQIERGELRPGDRVPSENELARDAGVSRITTKQALAELAQDGWVYRVRGKGTFVARALPRDERATRRGIGIFVPHLNNPYATRIILGVESELAKEGYHLIFRSGGTPQDEVDSVRDLLRAGIAGLIMWPAPGVYINEELVRLRLARFPIVLVDRYLRGLQVDCAQSDNLRGGFVATKHLLDLGHRQIAYAARSFRNVTSVEERHLGYQAALRAAGVIPRDDHLWIIPHDVDWTNWLKAHLDQHPNVTAIFCENDSIAVELLESARVLGVRVPQDLSLVGFDDADQVDQAHVPLTTVRQDAAGLGRTAARLLIERIERSRLPGLADRAGRAERHERTARPDLREPNGHTAKTTDEPDGARHVFLPVELVVRTSTAPPRQTSMM